MGWWSESVMGGDPPLDSLAALARECFQRDGIFPEPADLEGADAALVRNNADAVEAWAQESARVSAERERDGVAAVHALAVVNDGAERRDDLARRAVDVLQRNAQHMCRTADATDAGQISWPDAATSRSVSAVLGTLAGSVAAGAPDHVPPARDSVFVVRNFVPGARDALERISRALLRDADATIPQVALGRGNLPREIVRSRLHADAWDAHFLGITADAAIDVQVAAETLVAAGAVPSSDFVRLVELAVAADGHPACGELERISEMNRLLDAVRSADGTPRRPEHDGGIAAALERSGSGFINILPRDRNSETAS